MRLVKILLASAALLGASAPSTAQQASCGAMLSDAPENVLQLEVVRGCRGTGAACAYVDAATSYGVLTLICPASGVLQVFGADRLQSLRIRSGTLSGECRSGA